MKIVLTFEELGITPEFGRADIINRACDMVMELYFSEFEETDIIDADTIEVFDMRNAFDQDSQVIIPIKIKYNPEF